MALAQGVGFDGWGGVCHLIITQTTIEVTLTTLLFDVQDAKSVRVECLEENAEERQLLYDR